MSDKTGKNERMPLPVFILGLVIIFTIGIVIGYIYPLDVKLVQSNEQDYINANEWTEKCSEYEYYVEHEIEYNLTRLERIHCVKIWELCTISNKINNWDKICDPKYLKCEQKYGEPYIIILNQSRCIETILIKVNLNEW